MKRREFISKTFAGMILSSGALSFTGLFSSVIAGTPGNLSLPSLKAGELFIAQAGKMFQMPVNPSNGDEVYIIVDTTSVLEPCEIKANGATVMGDDGPLILDTLANIKLRYDAQSKDWSLS